VARVLLLILALCAAIGAQSPSKDEQQFLFSVLPMIEAGDLPAAEQRLLKGVSEFPRSAILNNALGIIYRKQNKVDQAVAAFRSAVQLMPGFTAAQLHLASIYEQQGNQAEARPLYRAAAEGTADFNALMTAGLGLAQCEDYPGAIVVLQKALSVQPSSASAMYNLALAQFQNGQPEDAWTTLQSYPKPDQQADVLYLRAKATSALKRPGAAEDLAAACRLQPSSESYCADAGIALIREERFVQAVDLLEKALLQSGASTALLPVLGLAQLKLGRYRDAIQTYTRTLDSYPRLDAAREGFAFLLYVTGDLEKARAVVEEGLKNPDADFYLAHLHAMILYRMSPQLRPIALKSVNRALERNPKFAPSYFVRGKIEMNQGSLDSALRDFEKSVQLDPKYPLPYYKMAQIYTRLGRAREAAGAAQKLSALGNQREEEILARQTQDLLMPAAP
jgi:tetratricopeptide (TPR) repeat protein